MTNTKNERDQHEGTNVTEISLLPWNGPWDDHDRDANFKHDVALYSKLDPMSTIGNLSASTGIPAGAICRYILAKWSSAGAEALMTLGATAIVRMTDAIDSAERAATDEARLAAYREIASQLAWLRHPLDHPEVYDEDPI